MMLKPLRCSICGLYLTTHPQFWGRRCLEPTHWLAAGLLQADDYYPLGQLVAQAMLERQEIPVFQKDHYEPVPAG
jgi:hypothetical protein